MIDDFLSNPDVVARLDLSQNTAKPHTVAISQDGDERVMIFASRQFWKTLAPEVVADQLTRWLLQPSQVHMADYLAAQARRQDKTVKDIAVVVIKFSLNAS